MKTTPAFRIDRTFAINALYFISGPLLTLAAGMGMELIEGTPRSVPNPSAIFMLILLYSAFRGGTLSGMITAAVAWYFTSRTYSVPHEFFLFTPDNQRRVFLWTIAYPSTALLVGWLKSSLTLETERAREAELNANRYAKLLELQLGEKSHALIETSMRLRNVVDRLPMVIWRVDKDGIFTLSEGAGLRRMGRSPLQTVGKSVYDVYRSAPEIVELHRRALAGEEQSGRSKVGGAVIDARYLPELDSKGDVIGVFGVAIDVTAEDAAGRDLRTAREDLERAQELAHIGSWSADPSVEKGAMDWSAEVYRIFGLTGKDFDGTTQGFFRLVHPDDRKTVETAMRKALVGDAAFVIDHRIVRPDGEVRWVHAEAHVERSADFQPRRMIGIIMDITERRRAERHLEELDALISRFIEIVSHQFRPSLNTARRHLEALLGDELGKLSPDQKKFVKIAHEADIEVIERIRDLLTAIDIEEGRTRLTEAEASVESIWAVVLADLRKRCAAKGLTCSYAPPDGPLPPVTADVDKMREVFQKLVDNAVTYTPKGGNVRTSLSRKDGHFRFEISDSGIGIPTNEQRLVEGRFFRATNAPAMRADASGLGLYIAKHFIERHGGRMGFSSQEGKGSTFWFEIPLR